MQVPFVVEPGPLHAFWCVPGTFERLARQPRAGEEEVSGISHVRPLPCLSGQQQQELRQQRCDVGGGRRLRTSRLAPALSAATPRSGALGPALSFAAGPGELLSTSWGSREDPAFPAAPALEGSETARPALRKRWQQGRETAQPCAQLCFSTRTRAPSGRGRGASLQSPCPGEELSWRRGDGVCSRRWAPVPAEGVRQQAEPLLQGRM
nr:PREDICTED: uncharacterized protein LOC106490062 isoform X1 [Apteryx mantelli mantelli]